MSIKRKFAITILVLLLLIFLANNFVNIFFTHIFLNDNYVIKSMTMSLTFILVTTVFLFKEKVTGWYLSTFYFGNIIITKSVFLFDWYLDLFIMRNTNTNWGNGLSYIYPLPEFIFSLIAVIICLKKINRSAYGIKL